MQFLCTHVLRFFTIRSPDVAVVCFRCRVRSPDVAVVCFRCRVVARCAAPFIPDVTARRREREDTRSHRRLSFGVSIRARDYMAVRGSLSQILNVTVALLSEEAGGFARIGTQVSIGAIGRLNFKKSRDALT